MRRTFEFARGRCTGGTLQLLVSPGSAKPIRSRLLRLAGTAPDLTFVVLRTSLQRLCAVSAPSEVDTHPDPAVRASTREVLLWSTPGVEQLA